MSLGQRLTQNDFVGPIQTRTPEQLELLTHKVGGVKTPYKRPPRGRQRARYHYVVLTCPHCRKTIHSDYRLRHTYVTYRNFLRKATALRQFFSARMRNKYLLLNTMRKLGDKK